MTSVRTSQAQWEIAGHKHWCVVKASYLQKVPCRSFSITGRMVAELCYRVTRVWNKQRSVGKTAQHTSFGDVIFTLMHVLTASCHCLLTSSLLRLHVLKLLRSDQTGSTKSFLKRKSLLQAPRSPLMLPLSVIGGKSALCRSWELWSKGSGELGEAPRAWVADQRAVPPGTQLPLHLLFTSGKIDEECEGSEGKISGTKPQMKLKFVIMERSQAFSPLSASGSGRNRPDSSCSQGSSNSSWLAGWRKDVFECLVKEGIEEGIFWFIADWARDENQAFPVTDASKPLAVRLLIHVSWWFFCKYSAFIFTVSISLV